MNNTKYRVVVVEDDKTMRESLLWAINFTLEDEKLDDVVEVAVFENSEQAYSALFPEEGQAILDPKSVLFILSDYRLPQGRFKDGIDLLDGIRSQFKENAPELGLISVVDNPLEGRDDIPFFNKFTAAHMMRCSIEITRAVRMGLEKRGTNSPEI